MGVVSSLSKLIQKADQVKVASHQKTFDQPSDFENTRINNLIPIGNNSAFVYAVLGWSWSICYGGTLTSDAADTSLCTRLALMASENIDDENSGVTFAQLFSDGVLNHNDRDVLWNHNAMFRKNVGAGLVQSFDTGNDGVIMLPSPIVVPNVCLWLKFTSSNIALGGCDLRLSFNLFYSKKVATLDLVENIYRQFKSLARRRGE